MARDEGSNSDWCNYRFRSSNVMNTCVLEVIFARIKLVMSAGQRESSSSVGPMKGQGMVVAAIVVIVVPSFLLQLRFPQRTRNGYGRSE